MDATAMEPVAHKIFAPVSPAGMVVPQIAAFANAPRVRRGLTRRTELIWRTCRLSVVMLASAIAHRVLVSALTVLRAAHVNAAPAPTRAVVMALA